jgi:hypothetical protein
LLPVFLALSICRRSLRRRKKFAISEERSAAPRTVPTEAPKTTVLGFAHEALDVGLFISVVKEVELLEVEEEEEGTPS